MRFLEGSLEGGGEVSIEGGSLEGGGVCVDIVGYMVTYTIFLGWRGRRGLVMRVLVAWRGVEWWRRESRGLVRMLYGWRKDGIEESRRRTARTL